MSCNWAGNLDMLAQNGVIDFDGASYIMGQPLRYVGNPSHPSPFNGQPPTITNLNQPKIDEFKMNGDKKDVAKPSSWKKWAFGALALGGLIFGGFKLKSKLIPWAKNTWNKVGLKSVGNWISKKAKSVGNFFKKGWNSAGGYLKKGWQATWGFCKKIGTSIGNYLKRGWNWFTGLFKSKKP